MQHPTSPHAGATSAPLTIANLILAAGGVGEFLRALATTAPPWEVVPHLMISGAAMVSACAGLYKVHLGRKGAGKP